jgi:hypothetical protein
MKVNTKSASEEKTFLWARLWAVLSELRPAFGKTSTFLWFAVAVAGLCIREDLAGVTSIVRALGLYEACYGPLLDMFHSRAFYVDRLAQLWLKLALKLFSPYVRHGRLVLLGDGIKAPKEGRKMPGVKSLHQESASNSKPEYIMGHSCQAVSLLVKAMGKCLAVPIISRIHEGVVFSNRCRKTLLDRMLEMLTALDLPFSYYFVADAYYATGKIANGLLDQGNHLITRVRSNAVAFERSAPEGTKRRGRKRLYGTKVYLRKLFGDQAAFKETKSPCYDDRKVTIRYRTLDLLWRPVGKLMRFVLVDYPGRGRVILMCSDLTLSAREIIRLYGLRFKIEVGFKQARYTLGTYLYHFWMATMKKISRGSGDQHPHRESKEYRQAVRRKIQTYHAYIQTGVVAQGLLLYLSACATAEVRHSFGSWLRTIRPNVLPSEKMVAMALRNTLPHFLAVSGKEAILQKFIRPRIDRSRAEGLRLVA